jgi:hypothetical protein
VKTHRVWTRASPHKWFGYTQCAVDRIILGHGCKLLTVMAMVREVGKEEEEGLEDWG